MKNEKHTRNIVNGKLMKLFLKLSNNEKSFNHFEFRAFAMKIMQT